MASSSFDSVQGFVDWGVGKPRRWRYVVAARAALRLLPLLTDRAESSQPVQYREKIWLVGFRAAFISFVTAKYPSHSDKFFRKPTLGEAEVVEGASPIVRGTLEALAASAIGKPSVVRRSRERRKGSADDVIGIGAITASAISGDAVAHLWESISADATWLINQAGSENGSASLALKLADQRLWIPDVRGNPKYNVNFPIWARDYWDAFKRDETAEQAGFRLWIRWYEAILIGAVRSGFNPRLTSDVTEILYLNIANKDDSFWQRRGLEVNREINSEIKAALAGRLSEQKIEAPPEPAIAPGPQYRPRGGKLSEEADHPFEDEAKYQASLHARLRADATRLQNDLQRVANRYPELANALKEYSALLDTETESADVTAIWSVGSAIASFAQSYREQNVARTLAEPLEPQLDAQLQNVVRQHGAFIMGFEHGRDLVQRADEFTVDRVRLQEIERPGTELLSELTENRNLVDDRTRALHRPILDGVTESGWVSSRVGYSAYIIVRNAVRAMIKFTVGENPNIGVIVGILAGGSALAGDPNVEFIRAAVPVLQQYGVQLLAFFNHSPEMYSYVEWALRILDSDQRGR